MSSGTQQEAEFQFPLVEIGTTVRVSKDHQNFADPQFGWVFNPKHGSADILTLLPGRGWDIIQAAKHRLDPSIQENPGWFEGGERGRGYDNSGVFELSPTEVRIRQIFKDYQELRRMMQSIEQNQRELAQRLGALEAKADPPKRGPGRPRKDLQPQGVG